MIKFLNMPTNPNDPSFNIREVIKSTPRGNYIDAQGDKLIVIAVDCFTCASDYEVALPGYKIVRLEPLRTESLLLWRCDQNDSNA